MDNYTNYRVASNAPDIQDGQDIGTTYNRRILTSGIFRDFANQSYQSVDSATMLKNRPMSRIDLTQISAIERLQTYVTRMTSNCTRLYEEADSMFLELECNRLRKWSIDGFNVIYNGTRPCENGYNFYVISDVHCKDIHFIVKSHQESVYAVELRSVSGDDYVHIDFKIDEFLAFAKCLVDSKLLPRNNKIKLRTSDKLRWCNSGNGYMRQNANLGLDFCDFWPNYSTTTRESRMFFQDKKIQISPLDSKLEIKPVELGGFARAFFHCHDTLDLLLDIEAQKYAVKEHLARSDSSNLDSHDIYHTALSAFYGLKVTPKRRYPASYVIFDYILPSIHLEFNMWYHVADPTSSSKSPAIYHARTIRSNTRNRRL